MKHMKTLVKNTERRRKIDEDLQAAQWAIQGQEEAKVVLELIAAKHLEEVSESPVDRDAVQSFFTYFAEQWGPDSHTAR